MSPSVLIPPISLDAYADMFRMVSKSLIVWEKNQVVTKWRISWFFNSWLRVQTLLKLVGRSDTEQSCIDESPL